MKLTASLGGFKTDLVQVQEFIKEGREMEIPNGPQTLTAEWLTQALRQNRTITRANVLSFQTQAIGVDGEGITGQTARINLVYDLQEPAAPEILIAKFHALDSEQRERTDSLGMYEREFRFYRYAAGRIELPIPRCYYGNYHENGTTVLLLEDLAPAQSVGSDPTPAQVKLAVQQLAGFHAYWWEHAQLNDIFGPPDPAYLRSLSARLQQTNQEKWDLVVELAGENLPQPMRAIGQRIVNNWAAIQSRLILSSPRTLIHGDFTGDNLLFATSEGGKPFTVIDWQLCLRGRGPYDVGGLLGTLPTEQRRKSEMDLLTMYYRILVENGVQGYSFEQCLEDYRLTALEHFARLVFVIREPNPGEDLKRFEATDHKFREIQLPRRCAAILDLDADELIME